LFCRDSEKRQAAVTKAQRPDDIIEKVDSTQHIEENAKSEPKAEEDTNDSETKTVQENVGPVLTKPILGYERRRRVRDFYQVWENFYLHVWLEASSIEHVTNSALGRG
jgi:hypothetical protein